MELNASTSSGSLKRKLQSDAEKVEENTNEIKRKIEPEREPHVSKEIKALMLVLHWHEYLMQKFGIQTCENICDMADLTIITIKICGYLNLKNSQQKEDIEFSCNGVVVKFSTIKDDILTMAKLYGLDYTVIDNEIADELKNLLLKMSAFQQRLQEIIKQIEGKVKVNRFLSGITYSKYHKMNMKSSMGLGTIATKLFQSTNIPEQNAWAKAFSHAFKEIPHTKRIVDYIKQNKKDFIEKNISYKCNFLDPLEYIATSKGLTKATNEVYIPAAIILTIARTKTEYKSFFDKPEFPLHTALSMQHICPAIQNIDFTYKGAFNIWNKAAKFEFRIKKLEYFTVQSIKELIFHAYFGTFYEDMQLLTWMTEHEFQTNEQLIDQWKEKTIAADDSTIIVTLIKVRYIAQLINKSTDEYYTNFSSNEYNHIGTSVFLQPGLYFIDDMERLFRNLYEAFKWPNSNIPYYLHELKTSISNIIPEMGRYSIFHNWFYEYDDTKYGAGVGNRVTDLPEYAGRDTNKNVGKYIENRELFAGLFSRKY